MPKDTFSQETLIKGILQNDEKVLKWIYQKNYPKILQLVVANSGTPELSKDLYQEAFLTFWTNVRTGKFQPESETALFGYLYQIAKNKWMDVVRAKSFKQTTLTETLPERIEEDADDRESYFEQLELALSQMGESCRELLTRFYFQRESLGTLAAHFGWTDATTKNNKYRCMEKLRNSIKNQS